MRHLYRNFLLGSLIKTATASYLDDYCASLRPRFAIQHHEPTKEEGYSWCLDAFLKEATEEQRISSEEAIFDTGYQTQFPQDYLDEPSSLLISEVNSKEQVPKLGFFVYQEA